MFGEKIIKLAQSDEAMEALVNSEMKVQEINNQFYELTKEYKMGSNTADYYSFFNFSNMYFWFVLIGLFLLAFGLLFLLAELQQRSKNRQTVVKFEEKPKEEKKPEVKPEPKPEIKEKPKEEKKIKEKPAPEKKLKKPVKVKVVKVK